MLLQQIQSIQKEKLDSLWKQKYELTLCLQTAEKSCELAEKVVRGLDSLDQGSFSILNQIKWNALINNLRELSDENTNYAPTGII